MVQQLLLRLGARTPSTKAVREVHEAVDGCGPEFWIGKQFPARRTASQDHVLMSAPDSAHLRRLKS